MVIAGAVYHVTKRCSQRMFLLRPGPVVNAVLGYCLARASALFDVHLHAVAVESNHIHLVLTDPQRRISDFMQWLNRQTGKCLLEHYAAKYPRRPLEAIWSKDPFSATMLVTSEAVLEALLYVFTNCVKDGLVSSHRRWPGLLSSPRDWVSAPRTFRRPELYFRQDQEHFAHANLNLSIPAPFADRDPTTFARNVEQMLLEHEAAIAATAHSSGRSFAGRERVLRVDPFSAPSTGRERGKRNPHIAAGRGQTTALVAALRVLRWFREAYRQAYREFVRGMVRAVFPAGTFLMARVFGIQCHPDDPLCALALGRCTPAAP